MPLQIYSTCPQSRGADQGSYLSQVEHVARWSERFGCHGILVYSDNGLVDPWLVAQIILRSTLRLRPLVAVQPVYMHPYAVAKQVASLGYLYQRPVCLNMIAGGFKNDLSALGDDTPHDDRYARLTEYTDIVKRLLASTGPVSLDGQYYRVSGLAMTPTLPPELQPQILVSGSSPAGLAAARAMGAVPIKYPADPATETVQEPSDGIRPGVRIGIIARDDAEEAWRVAHDRFPPDRQGQIAHQLAMKVSDSQWHKQLSDLAAASSRNESPYWLGPFENYKTFCPYLVGSYRQVAAVIERYVALGFETFILDIPPCEEELLHTSIVFQEALQGMPSCR